MGYDFINNYIKDYKSFINELSTNLGSTTLSFRKKIQERHTFGLGKEYGDNISLIFPGRGTNRNAGQQGGYQLLALVATLLISIIGGLGTGRILNMLNSNKKEYANDEEDWEV